jgi:hypothetical protein
MCNVSSAPLRDLLSAKGSGNSCNHRAPVREGRPLNGSPPDFLRLPCSLHLSRRCAYYPRRSTTTIVPPAHRIACTASTPLLSSLSFLRCASTITSPPRITTSSSFSSRLLVLYIIRTSRFLNLLVDDISASASFMFFPQTTAQYAYAQHAMICWHSFARAYSILNLASRAHYSRLLLVLVASSHYSCSVLVSCRLRSVWQCYDRYVRSMVRSPCT